MALAQSAEAGDFVLKADGLYRKYEVFEPRVIWGKTYYHRKIRIQKVLERPKYEQKSYGTWQAGAAELLKQIESDNAFLDFVKTIGAQNTMNKPIGYESRSDSFRSSGFTSAGSTVGGFYEYDYSRYGDVDPLDANRAHERIAQRIDQRQRLDEQSNRYARENNQDTTGLIDQFSTQTGAVMETQELRASMVEIGHTMRDMVRELRAAASERVRVRQQVDGTGPARPREGRPGDSDDQGATEHPGALLMRQFCSTCHGGATPEKDLLLPAARFSRLQKGKILLALDRDSPVGVRMPPADKPQPSDDERRLMGDYILSVK